jgi:hypothetical protein
MSQNNQQPIPQPVQEKPIVPFAVKHNLFFKKKK